MTASWTRFSTAAVADPALARTKDGALHIVWRSGDRILHGMIDGKPTQVGGAWDASLSSPCLIAAPDGSPLHALFTTKAGLHTATSKDGGTTWDLAAPTAPHGPVFAATGDKDGKPIVITPHDVRPEGSALTHLALALDAESAEGWAAWHESAPKSGARLLFSKAVKPPSGAPRPAPGAPLAPTQRLALSARLAAPGVYLAYGVPAGIRLWNVRGGEALVVAGSPGARTPCLAPGPEGRLWILWRNAQGSITALRTNRTLQRFSKPYQLGKPPGAAGAYLAAEASTGPLDIFAGEWHARVLPALEVEVTPQGVQVTDVADPVEDAQVEFVGGKTVKTDAKGLAAIPTGAGAPVKITRAGYAPR